MRDSKPCYDSEMLQYIIDFIEEIGISVIEKELDNNCFLPGITLGRNALLLDRNRLKYPGDLLHEAGHLALTSENERLLIGTAEMNPGWPDGGNEIGAILWSYAAVCYLKIPVRTVFHKGGYKKDSEWLIEQFESGEYIGLPLLKWMGFCNTDDPNTKLFPELNKWLR